jgi:membrane-associated phospholipid phosphatase
MKTITVAMLCASLAGLVPLRAQSTGPVEPNGGTWKTWVLANGSQLRLPPPPDAAVTQNELGWLKLVQANLDDNLRGSVAYWDQGSPSYHWVQWLENHIINLNVNTPNGTRQMALLNVAIYDAMVAAYDSKYSYKRPSPSDVDASFRPLVSNSNAPSYPNDFAVAAGAAAAVLSYLYPTEASSLQDMAQIAGKSRLYGGVAFPSDYFAGLQLGDQVGQLVIQRAKSDGSSAVWTGTVPTGPGMWTGTNPVCPLCGTWKTWAIGGGSQFRPGPPIAYNSPAKLAELASLKAQPRPFADQAKAFFWQTGQGVITTWYDSVHTAIFEDHLTGNALRAARAYALMSVAQYDAMVACWDGKYGYWAIRPIQLDPSLTTLFATPNHPSYPAAHATNSTAISDLMTYLFPARVSTFTAMAAEAGWSRMVAGIHYQSDIDAGNTLGHSVAQAVIDWANKDGSDK